MQKTAGQPGDAGRHRVRSGLVALGILVAFVMIAVGCGNPRNTDTAVAPTERDASLRQIAADYARGGDLALAQAALDKLGLANPTQLLVSLAEADASAGRATEEVAPMARLAAALGARSAKLIAYLEPTPTAVPPTPIPSPVPPSPTAAPTLTPTPEPPTDTPEPPTVTPTPEPQQPRAVADADVNLRGGPGKAYPVVGKLLSGQEVEILGRNTSGDWWQLAWTGGKQAWVAGTVVQILGPIDTVAVAKNIPAPPPLPTRAPQATAAPPPTAVPAGPDFRVTNIRLWGVEENGGFFDGPSVHCGEKRQLRITVVDAGGNPVNGVTLKSALTDEEQVTGSKGPGIAEYVLGGGQDIYVLRDADGRNVTSDVARGMSTNPNGIPTETLVGAGYCRDEADCAHFRNQWGCNGHYSWDVTFRRAY
jgi:hypothetical protein